MTAILPDSDLIHLDFTPDCQAANCQHNHPPATHVVTLACGCIILHCPACVTCAKAAVQVNLWTNKATCRQCGRIFHDVTTRQLYVSIKPL